jgi:hypothetical protein
MAELSGGPRPIRPATVRTPLPPRSPPADRRLLTNRVVSINPPRGPCGARADTADCRIKPKPAEPAPRERAEAALPALPAQPVASAAPAQQAPSVYGFKVLPTSCWSGGASRWRWWRAGQDVPCK